MASLDPRSDDRLEGKFYSFEMGTLALILNESGSRIDARDPYRVARILHEYDHLVRLLGTSFGLVRHGFLTAFVEWFIRGYRIRRDLDSFQRDWRKVCAHASPALDAGSFGHLFHGDPAFSDLYRARCILDALRALDGKNLSGEGIGIGSMAGWMHYVSLLIDGKIPDQPNSLLRLGRLWANPKGIGNVAYIDGAPVSVHDILEYLGVVAEVAQQGHSGVKMCFPEDLDPAVYLRILNVVKKFLPKALDHNSLRIARELEGLLELCLWIPLWPGMTEEELPPHAVHLIPSYRLLPILDACRELDLEFRLDGDSDVSECAPAARSHQEAICRHLGWPSPVLIAEKWSLALGRLEQVTNSWTPWYLHHPRSRRAAWSRKLLLECSIEPIAGAILAPQRHYPRIGFTTIYQGDPSVGYLPNGEVEWPEEDRDFQKLDLLMFSSRYAPNPSEWAWLSSTVREESEETWRRLIAAEPF